MNHSAATALKERARQLLGKVVQLRDDLPTGEANWSEEDANEIYELAQACETDWRLLLQASGAWAS